MTSTSTDGQPARSIHIYLLAADADRPVCEAIVKHLKPVVREFAVPVHLLSDFDVPAGSEVSAHRQQLLAADIVLALISADFINDDAIYQRIQAVTTLHNAGKLVMIPLLVRNCLWKATPFARLGMLPRNFQPLNNLQFWPSTDDALMAVVDDVYAALATLSQQGGAKVDALRPGPAQATVAPLSTPGVAALAAAMPTDAAPRAAPATSPPAPLEASADWRRDYYRNLIWKRTGAIAIDWVVALLLWFVWLLGYFAMHAEASSEFDNTDIAVLFVIFYVLCPLMEASSWQGTVGKRMLGLQITDHDGRRIGLGRAFWRTVLRSFVLYGYLISFGLLAVVQYVRFKKTRKLFHDELSNTLIGERLASTPVSPARAAAPA